MQTQTPVPAKSTYKPAPGPGRPSLIKRKERLGDEGQAYEIIKDKWTLISDTLADEALKAARSRKKDGKSLVATCTAAGIAYDKRWSKQVNDNTEISIPPSLASQITKKLHAQPQVNQVVTEKVAHLTQVCDLSNEQARQCWEEMIGL